MTVEGSADPGGEPSGPQDDLDSKLGVPLLRLEHTTREPPQDVADKLEQKRRDSGRLGISDKGIPIPDGPTIADEVLDHIERVAGVYVRDMVAHLYPKMKPEQREWFCSKIPPEGSDPLGGKDPINITRGLLQHFSLCPRAREGDYSKFDIASVVKPSEVLFSVRTRVNKTKTDEVDNRQLLEALQWMDSADEQPLSDPGDTAMDEESQKIWEYAGALVGYLAQRNLLHPDDRQSLLEGVRKEFPGPGEDERKLIVTRARELDQIAVEAALMDFELDYPNEGKSDVSTNESVEIDDDFSDLAAPKRVIDFEAVEQRAGPAVRDLLERLHERMTNEEIDEFHRKLEFGPFTSPLKAGERESLMGVEQQWEVLHDLTATLHLVRNPVKDREGYLAFVDDVGHKQDEAEMATRCVYVVRPPRVYDPKPGESSKLDLRDSADGDIDDPSDPRIGKITKIGDIPALGLVGRQSVDPEKTPVAGVPVSKPRTTPVVPQPPVVAPKPPERLTGRKASKEPPLDFGESTDLAHSLVGVQPPATASQDSSEGSVVVKRRSPESDRVKSKRKPTDTDDESVPPGPLPGPITGRFNREEILGRSSQEMEALPPVASAPPSEPPKPSWLKRIMRFMLWVLILLALVVLGGYMAIDTLVGDVPSRWDGQVSVASVTSLLSKPEPKPQPVIIPLEERPLVMVDGARVSSTRDGWVVTVPLRKQTEETVLFTDDRVKLELLVECSSNERELSYVGAESQMLPGNLIQLRVYMRAPLGYDLRGVKILPYLVEK